MVCFCISQSHSFHWSSPVCSCLQEVCFCINRASILSLIIPCAFLLIDSMLLHQQSLILVADHSLLIGAHRECVSVSTVLTLLLIIPCAFLLIDCVYLLLFCIVPVAHNMPFIIPSSWCVVFSHGWRSFNEFCPSYMLTGGMHHMHHSCLHIFNGYIPRNTFRRYEQSHMLSLHWHTSIL